MEFLTSSENQKAIKELRKGLGKSYDLFLYGDKNSGTKPGNLSVYGTIAGQKEVLKNRLKLQKQLEEEEQNQLQ